MMGLLVVSEKKNVKNVLTLDLKESREGFFWRKGTEQIHIQRPSDAHGM